MACNHRQQTSQAGTCNPLKIAIVVDMWLTGFDVPSLATMYVYKPMESYNLMQAIARVNGTSEGCSSSLLRKLAA